MQHISIIELVSLYNHYEESGTINLSDPDSENKLHQRKKKLRNEIDRRVDNITFK